MNPIILSVTSIQLPKWAKERLNTMALLPNAKVEFWQSHPRYKEPAFAVCDEAV